MGLFSKRNTPNYNTVPATDGPVIDVFSLNGEGYNTVNASNGYLLLSGIRYWNMQVNAYGCNTDVNVARCNASRFFSRLWDNGYYTEEPGVGWYIALYTVFHDSSWSDLSRQAMGVWCEHVLSLNGVDLHELWYTAMMYITFCGGSIDQVVSWLHRNLEKVVTQPVRKAGISNVLTLLKHYKLLQAIVKEDPFQRPEIGGDLRDYWAYIANKYMLQEALLEYALADALMGHDPYYLNIHTVAQTGSINNHAKYEYAVSNYGSILNKAAQNGNLLAMSVCSLATWVYDTPGNKLRYKSYDAEIRRLDGYVLQNRKTVFPQQYGQINTRIQNILRTAKILQEAETQYATGLYHYSIQQPQEAAQCMQQAAAHKDALADIWWPKGKLDPVARAELWLRRHQGENYAISDENTKDLNEIETRSDKSFSKPGELRFRRFGEYLRDGYMGMQPQPELWKNLRKKALHQGKALGMVLYASDEDADLAHDFFQTIINNSAGKWNQTEVSFGWMGLAWQRHLQEDYSTVEEALQFLTLNPKARQLFPNIDNMVIGARMKNPIILETFADAFTFNREVHTNHPVLKGLGKIFGGHLSRIYEDDFQASTDENARQEAIGRWAENELLYMGVSPKLVNLVKQGMDLGSVKVYSLLTNEELLQQLRLELGLYKLHEYVQRGIRAGAQLTKQDTFLWDEIQRFEQELREAEARKEELRRRKFEELTRSSSHNDDAFSLVDLLMDHEERKANDGLTNEELYNRGQRSEFDHERDEEIRKYLKNPLGW